MKREIGFYWIKKYEGWEWETAYWDSKFFYLHDDHIKYSGHHFFRIHETPIPCPSTT